MAFRLRLWRTFYRRCALASGFWRCYPLHRRFDLPLLNRCLHWLWRRTLDRCFNLPLLNRSLYWLWR